ncbi:hypothetical protein GC197_06600 [bacterium]|nr:hypothetical protein [bacterium]
MNNPSRLSGLFPYTFVVNLPSRDDRWNAFVDRMKGRWPFGELIRFPAINGTLAAPPSWWKAGNGAWGCYRSHYRILEDCLTNKINRVMIMEDDAFLTEGFEDACAKFFQNLPQNWGIVYLGGQHLEHEKRLPRKLNDWVYRPYNVNRTHCYAVQGRESLQSLYEHLGSFNSWKEGHHIDHHYGEFHKKCANGIFVPARWLVGQAEGMSSITNKEAQESLWLGAEQLTNGKIVRTMVAVLGCFRGGTSCVTGILSHLGLDLGTNLMEPNQNNPDGFFEDNGLGGICRNIFREPWLERQLDPVDAANLLRRWASLRCESAANESSLLVGKHPILCMLGAELETAWNSPKILAVDRPVEDSIKSLKKANWGWSLEAIEYVIPKMLEKRDSYLSNTPLDCLRIDFDRLRAEPAVVIDEICQFLGHVPSDDARQAAIEFVR